MESLHNFSAQYFNTKTFALFTHNPSAECAETTVFKLSDSYFSQPTFFPRSGIQITFITDFFVVAHINALLMLHR